MLGTLGSGLLLVSWRQHSRQQGQAWGRPERRKGPSAANCFPSAAASTCVPEAAGLTRGAALVLLSIQAEEMKGRTKILALSQEINWPLLKNAACLSGQQRTGCGLDSPRLKPINQRTKCEGGGDCRSKEELALSS